MRIVKLEIERFMGIRDVAINVDPNLQLIAGPNNAGKTTIFRALELFFNPPGLEHSRVKPQNHYYGAEGPRVLTRVRVHFGHLTETERAELGEWTLTKSKQVWSEVRVSRAGQLAYDCSGDGSPAELHEALLSRINLIHVPAVRVDRGLPDGTDTERLAAAVRDVLVRSRPGPRTEMQQLFGRRVTALTSVLGQVLEQSKGPIAELVAVGIALEFQLPDASSLLDAAMSKVELRPQAGTEIRLRDEGTGIQSLLSLGILKYAASRQRSLLHVFLIEEPEAFLHPQLQRSVSQHLRDLSRSAQVIATTHSPVLVDSVDLRCVCRLPRDPEGLRYAWKAVEMTDATAGRLSRHCDAKNSELVFARRLVLCEGPSDVGAIEALLGTDLRQFDVSVVDTGGATKAADFVRLARHFKIPYLVVLDVDQVRGDRSALRTLAELSGNPLAPADHQELERLARQQCRTAAEASTWRTAAQVVLQERSVFCLGHDVEGAVAFSYRRTELLTVLGPGELGHMSADSVEALGGMNGPRYRQRLRQLVGSKGWNVEPYNAEHKMKPHVPRAVITRLGSPRAGSDLADLRAALTTFVRTPA